MGIKVNIKINNLSEKYAKRLDKAQYVLDSAIVSDTEPYVPFRTGQLSASWQKNQTIGEGRIIYDVPYAKKMYYGVSANGNSYNYNKSYHPLATSHWLEKAKETYLESWLEKVAKALRNDN